MLKHIDACSYPYNSPLTGYQYGCRCGTCTLAKTQATQRYRAKYPEKTKKQSHDWVIKSKIWAFEAYGGAVCNCCGERRLEFLSLDHVFNDGFKDHKHKNGRYAGAAFYSRLRKLRYPDKNRYQVLCMNCNFGKKINNGVCPHKETL